MLKKIVGRPVLATVVSIIIVILGIIGLNRLSITRFPDISPPTVTVSGTYPGGNSETVIRSVVTPLEEQINGVERMQYLKTTASNDGSFSITVVFKQGTDPDQAAVNVQNRVQEATPVLPAEVVRAGISTSKQQNSMIMIFNLYSKDNRKYDETFLQNYASINLIPQIKRVQGVGQVQVFGVKDYSMRVYLDPGKMAAYGLEPSDITAAIADQSLEVAPGSLGEESNAALQYVVKYKGKKFIPEDYENITVKVSGNGMVRLKDVARVEFGSISYNSDNKSNGRNSVTLAVLQNSGSNANEIEKGVDVVLRKLSRSFPPGIGYSKVMSTKDKLDASIHQVTRTLLEAFVLVFLVVFLFLQDIRSTLIPTIAVPVAIVGSFFFLLLMGFTINMLTLFALVLAIGIVVDDAIIVVEAVHVHLHKSSPNSKVATHAAMTEITGAVVTITMVMAAVFLPIGFMQGSSGIFYRQFAYTLAIAILISAVNALTLSPALCALLLKDKSEGSSDDADRKSAGFAQRFNIAFNAGFSRMTARYAQVVELLTRRKWMSAGIIGGTIIAALWLMTATPKSFVPSEDDGMFVYSLSMPPGTALSPTTEVVRKIDRVLSDMPAVEEVTSISGFNMLSNSVGPSYALGFVKLKPKDKRGPVKDIDDLLVGINESLSQIKEGTIIAMQMPAVDGFGMTNGAEVVIQDRADRGPKILKSKVDEVIAQMMAVPGVQLAYTSFRADYPQLELTVDEDKAKQMGVSVSNLLNTIQVYFSGDQSQNFSRFGKFYRVNIKADGIFRMDEKAFDEIFVKNKDGQMVPVNTLITLHKVYGPESLDRYNMYNSATITVMAQPGVSNGDMMNRLDEMLKKLPSDYSYEWTGLSLEEKESGAQALMIFGLCLLFVYFLLAAQFESYLLPFAVVLSVPAGILGAFVGVNLVGLDNNIYVQVGLIMLIGLLAKNAILIVEFAAQRRRSGLSIQNAAVKGAKARLRPIIMTSLTFIVGMIPLMFVTGQTAMGNRSISVSTALGMLIGVAIGIFTIPLLYILFQYLHEKIAGSKSVMKKA